MTDKKSALNLFKNYSSGINTDPKPIVFPDIRIEYLDITPNAFKKMHAYREIYDEYTGMGLEFFAFQSGLYRQDLTRNIHLGENQDNEYAHTLIQAIDVKNCLKTLPKNLHLRGWTHRHPRGIRSSSGEDAENNRTTIEEIQSFNYFEKYILVPQDHTKFDFVQDNDGTLIKGFDPRDKTEYVFHLDMPIAEAKEHGMAKFLEKRIKVQVAYAHSMIIREVNKKMENVKNIGELNEIAKEAFSEVILREFTGSNNSFTEYNGVRSPMKLETKIRLIEVPDDIEFNMEKFRKDIRSNVYIPKDEKGIINVNKGLAFGMRIEELCRMPFGGYEALKKEGGDKMQGLGKQDYIEMFNEYLSTRWVPDQISEWKKEVMKEKKPLFAKKQEDISDKTKDEIPATDAPQTVDSKLPEQKVPVPDNRTVWKKMYDFVKNIPKLWNQMNEDVRNSGTDKPKRTYTNEITYNSEAKNDSEAKNVHGTTVTKHPNKPDNKGDRPVI